MLRTAAFTTALVALALPAAAQQATPSDRIDWNKPVVGVDGLPQKVVAPVDEAISIEVYTIEDLKRESGAASVAVIDALRKQPEPPCDPDRKPAASGKSEVLSVCPAPTPAKPAGKPQ